jgi:hypothetical protein
MKFDFKLVCQECGAELSATVDAPLVLSTDGITGTIHIALHECKKTEERCTLSQALDAIKDGHVEVGYFKKDGTFRALNGFFPYEDFYKAKLGHVIFMERVGYDYDFKNLIRTGISSIEKDGYTYLIV